MIIENLARLCDWSAAQATACGALDSLPQDAAGHAVECIAGVIWRHALGQGLRPGDDWGWILEMYDPARIREIATESAAIHRPR